MAFVANEESMVAVQPLIQLKLCIGSNEQGSFRYSKAIAELKK